MIFSFQPVCVNINGCHIGGSSRLPYKVEMEKHISSLAIWDSLPSCGSLGGLTHNKDREKKAYLQRQTHVKALIGLSVVAMPAISAVRK